MREIKYRAWGAYLRSEDYQYHYFNLPTDMERLRIAPIRLGKWEQFTGLTDKNDKDIYEGDILKHRQEDYIGTIWLGAGCCMTNCRGWGDECAGDLHEDTIEVIGNIHQNPELLEAT